MCNVSYRFVLSFLLIYFSLSRTAISGMKRRYERIVRSTRGQQAVEEMFYLTGVTEAGRSVFIRGSKMCYLQYCSKNIGTTRRSGAVI